LSEDLNRRTALTGLTAAAAGPALAQSKGSTRTMRVYEIGDGTTGLRLVERPMPTPGHGEVLMRVRATGINARDLTIMDGGSTPTGERTQPATRVPLSDNAGEVAAVGPGVTRVKVGDRVTMTHYWEWIDGAWNASMTQKDYANNIDGFLAEYVIVPAEPLIVMPDSITFEEASTIQSAGLTSWNAVIEAGNVKPGDVVLTIGTGGVSVFGMQWAKMAGATVIITSSSDDKLAKMRDMGADITINYRTSPNWAQEVLNKTGGRGADIVLNNVGVQEMDGCLISAASNGRIMHIGANPVSRDRKPVPPPPVTRMGSAIIKDLTIKGIIVGSRRMFEDLLKAMAANNIKPLIDKVFPFDQARDAVTHMQSGDRLGKVVIKIP